MISNQEFSRTTS